MKQPPKTICDALDELYEENSERILKCRYCDLILPHANQFGVWVAMPHVSKCLMHCLGGGVSAGEPEFHSDMCPRCYPVTPPELQRISPSDESL